MLYSSNYCIILCFDKLGQDQMKVKYQQNIFKPYMYIVSRGCFSPCSLGSFFVTSPVIRQVFLYDTVAEPRQTFYSTCISLKKWNPLAPLIEPMGRAPVAWSSPAQMSLACPPQLVINDIEQ